MRHGCNDLQQTAERKPTALKPLPYRSNLNGRQVLPALSMLTCACENLVAGLEPMCMLPERACMNMNIFGERQPTWRLSLT